MPICEREATGTPRRPALTLGTAQLGSPYGIANRGPALTEPEVNAILDSAWQLGVVALDTAPDYGQAERRIGTFLRRRPECRDWAICTKLPKLPDGLPTTQVETEVARAVDASRRALGRERIDVYLVHGAGDLAAHGTALVDALARRREAGQVGSIGASVYDPDEAVHVLATSAFTAIQFPFNLFDRRMREDSRLAAMQDGPLCTMARSALLQGLFALDPAALPASVAAARPWLEGLRRLAHAAGAEPVPVALAYAANRCRARQLVLGVDSVQQLREAHRLLDAALDPALAAALDHEFEAVPAAVFDPRQWKPA